MTGPMGEQQKTMGRNTSPQTQEREEIRLWLEGVKFRTKALGGVDELDVWNKLLELDGLYEQAIAAERVRYDTLLDNYKKNLASEVRRMVAEYQRQHGEDV